MARHKVTGLQLPSALSRMRLFPESKHRVQQPRKRNGNSRQYSTPLLSNLH